jgi:hypothetical protein
MAIPPSPSSQWLSTAEGLVKPGSSDLALLWLEGTGFQLSLE